jgi:NADPH:quinone reductase-like Zn-dependent oxidoreductase
MTAIRKAVITGAGDPSHVTVLTSPIPAPLPAQVQLKVLHASFGGGDIAMRLGGYPQQKKAPFTPGYACIGRVLHRGDRSTLHPRGALVAALTKYDAQAERINVAEADLVPVPDGVDPAQAVALVLDWATAYGMVRRAGRVESGMRVFVHGLSGSVGFALLTLCKAVGAEVYGTASVGNHAAVRKAGAVPFVYTDKNWIMGMNSIGGAHVVFDPLGFESWNESYGILAPEGGVLVGYGGNYNALNGGETRSQFPQVAKLLARNLNVFTKSRTTFFWIAKEQSTFRPELETLFQMLENGEIEVPIRASWTLEQVPEAHRMFNKGPGVGAVVIKVADDNEIDTVDSSEVGRQSSPITS